MKTIFSALLCALVTSSCAYQFGSSKPAQLAQVESIAVPTFINDTLEPRIAPLVTNAVVKEFHRDGTYTVQSVSGADVIVQGKILKVTRRQARSERNNVLQTTEFDVSIDAQYQVINAATGELIFEGTSRGSSNFFLDPNIELSERQAFPLAAEDLAHKIVNAISEGWSNRDGLAQRR